MTASAPEASGVDGGGARSLTADELARAVGGTLVGDGGAVVSSVAPLERAGPDELSFLASARYAPLMARSRAGVVLVSPELAGEDGSARARIIVQQPHEALLAVLPRLYAEPARPVGIHPTARLGRGVALGAQVAIGPYATIGDGARIGDRVWVEAQCVVGAGVSVADDARLHPGVVLYGGSDIGRRVILHAGVRIGCDGFGYVWRDGRHDRIPHVGRCIIQDDVEIGANSTVDRGSIDDTVVGAGTKIDNLVHIGHNVRIGRLCLLMAQVGIAGSARIEDGVIIAGQAGLAGHITVGAGARIAGQAGVFGDVPAGESWSGYPARPHRESLRAQAALFRLAGMVRQLGRLLEKERA